MTAIDDISADDLRETIAKVKITDLLNRYSRGIDRCDINTLSAVFWPDATTDYGSGSQNAVEWANNTVNGLKRMHRTMHAISNMVIDVDGDRAKAETYCQAYHEIDGAEGRVEMVVGGRYLDRLERRDGAWRIAQRTYVMDWNRNIPSTCEWEAGIYAGLKTHGGRLPNDPLRDFLAEA